MEMFFAMRVEQILVPCLWPGAVVVMDNLSAHKVMGIQETLEAAGAQVVYLSPYSPDFNPIENFWSKLKEYLRSVAARTRETLETALKTGLELISLKDIRNWFAHCCYCDSHEEVRIVASEMA
jgi:transposase